MVREIEVDLWKTGMHSVEIGIKKDAEHQAKSRQFTQDTDIIGEYSYKDENLTGYLSIREDPWKADLSEKRLIMKIFTESINWKASVEEMVALGVTRTIATGEGMPVYSINLNNYDNLIRLERTFKPMSMNKAMYTFMLIEDNKLIPYIIEADRFTLGSDWDVFNENREKVAEIDGKKFNIGGKYVVKIYDDKFDLHPAFDEVILLFASLVKYESDVRKKLEETAEKMKNESGEFNLKIANEEVGLYDNPRRIQY